MKITTNYFINLVKNYEREQYQYQYIKKNDTNYKNKKLKRILILI